MVKAIEPQIVNSVEYYTNQLEKVFYGKSHRQSIRIVCNNQVFSAQNTTYADSIYFQVLSKGSIIPSWKHDTFDSVLELNEIDNINRIMYYSWGSRFGCLYNWCMNLTYHYLMDSIEFRYDRKPSCDFDPNDLMPPCSDGLIKHFSSQ